MMLIWPANSWVFWALVAVALILFLRFGIFSRREAKSSRTRLYVLAAIAAVLIVVCAVLPSIVFAGLTGAGASADSIDIALWSLAAAFVLSAIALTCLGLFGDRSRGRKRCPKCWYDMSGSPTLTCPECGKAAAAERKLLKTRRRWSLVALAAVLLVISAATAIAPKVRNDTWPELLPDVVFIAAAPFTFGGNAFQGESYSRFEEEAFVQANCAGWPPRRALANWAMTACLREQSDPTIIFRGIVLAYDPSHNVPEVRSLIGTHTANPNSRVSRSAIQWFAGNARDEPEAIVVFDRVFATNDRFAAKMITPAFIDIPAGAPRSSPVGQRLLALASRPEPLARATAARFLASFAENADLLLWRERALADESPDVRAAAISSLLFVSRSDPLVINATLDALRRGEDKLLDSAVWALALSESQNERLWRAFPGAIARLGKTARTSQIFDHLSRERSPVRLDALLRVGEESGPWLEVAQSLRNSEEFSPLQIQRMRALAADWRDRGNAQAAGAMDIAIKHAESTLMPTDASLAP